MKGMLFLCSLMLTSHALADHHELSRLLKKYQGIRTSLITNLNERSIKYTNLLPEYIKEVDSGLAVMDTYQVTYKLFYKKLLQTAGAQLDMSSLGLNLLMGESVSTDGVKWTIPVFNFDTDFKWCDFQKAYDNVLFSSKSIQILINKFNKTKKKLLRRNGGVNERSPVIIEYNRYIRLATQLKLSAIDIAKLVKKSTHSTMTDIHSIRRNIDAASLDRTVRKVARRLSSARRNLLKAQSLLKTELLNHQD